MPLPLTVPSILYCPARRLACFGSLSFTFSNMYVLCWASGQDLAKGWANCRDSSCWVTDGHQGCLRVLRLGCKYLEPSTSQLLQAGSSHLPTTTKYVQRKGSFHRSRNWGPQTIISAHMSKSKENPSVMLDPANSCLGHREIEARVSTLTKILE